MSEKDKMFLNTNLAMFWLMFKVLLLMKIPMTHTAVTFTKIIWMILTQQKMKNTLLNSAKKNGGLVDV